MCSEWCEVTGEASFILFADNVFALIKLLL